MDEVVELQNMENVCRLCLSTDEPKISVFGEDDSSVSLASKIQVCLSIQISSTDRLSSQICAQCVRNINQWHDYKEACLRSQDKLHQWLEKHLQSPMVITIKDEPVDLDFYEDNIEVISESTNDSDTETSNLDKSVDNLQNHIEVQDLSDDEIEVDDIAEDQPALTKDIDICVKAELHKDSDTDCTIEIESVTGSELVLNPLSNAEDRIMEADSTQKFNASSTSKKKQRRGPHTHFRGARVYKQKCVHCQINLHSKYSYTKHMERFHSDKQNDSANTSELQDEEELIEDLEDELMSMEKDAPLTQVQQNIISQLKTFSCYSCEQSFNDRRTTLKHIRQHMPDLRPYTCIACLTEFPDRSMYKLHCGASFECAMKIALIIPKQGEEKYFTCNMCLRSMKDRKQLLSHLSKHSDKQYEELVSPSRSPPKLKPMAPLPLPALEGNRPIKKSPEAGLNIPRPYKNGDPAHNHACDLCGMIYRYRPNMVKHRDLCQRLSPDVRTSYRCIHCGMTYLVFKKFHSHITVDHRKKEFTCSECGSKFRSPGDFLDHHKTHRTGRNKQSHEVKNESMNSMQNISTPIKDWDTFEAEVNANKIMASNHYSCALCNLEFATRAELTEHRNLHLKVKIYSCVICRSMFSSAGALEVHMKDHGIEDANERNANVSCVEYGTVVEDSRDSSSINASVSSDAGATKNDCDMCGKVFSNNANLKRHIKNLHKHGKAHVSCTQCTRMFKSKEARARHIATEHTKTKTMHQCSQCPKAFVYRTNLHLHIQTAHGEKSYGCHKCDICGKEFAEEVSLKIHRSWHNRANSRLSTRFMKVEDKKPLITPKQEEPFNASTGRPARARKSFPNSPPAKPIGNFQCQVCSDKFSDVTELREHLWDVHCARNKGKKSLTGDEFQCELCTNIFPDKETLDVHLQWHKAHPILCEPKSRNFPCETCGKLYSSKKTVTRHMKLHKATAVASAKLQSLAKTSGQSQPMCNVCHKVFQSNQTLQRHKLNMHRGVFGQQQPQTIFNNATRTSQDEPKPKKIKLEEEDRKMPFAMDALNAGKRSVMCHVCRKFFANMSVLYKHKQLVHNKTNPIKNLSATLVTNECIPIQTNDGQVACNVCYKKFPGMSNLRQHFTVKHTKAMEPNVPQYTCSIDGCKLMFGSAITLKNHEISHSSMIFSCILCEKHVFNRTAVSNHMWTVHKTSYDAEHSKTLHREMDLCSYSVDGAVDAVCPRCDIKYPNNRALKIHYFKFHEGKNE